MQRTKIEWTDISWNPETGCNRGCWYCYANRMFTRFHKSFKPTFYPERLNEIWNLKPPTERNNLHRKPWIAKAFPQNWLIFICSVADLFASWTDPWWRDQILNAMWTCCRSHIYQLLTKNPERIPLDYDFPENVWVGTTVTNENLDFLNIGALKKVHAKTKFVSFEPLLGSLPKVPDISLQGIQWIILGKLTGSRKVPLQKAWVYDILGKAKQYDVPVFMKDSLFQVTIKTLSETLDIREQRREFPNWQRST